MLKYYVHNIEKPLNDEIPRNDSAMENLALLNIE